LHDLNASTARPEMSDHIWLNRKLVAEVLRQSAGKPCLRSGGDGFDGSWSVMRVQRSR